MPVANLVSDDRHKTRKRMLIWLLGGLHCPERTAVPSKINAHEVAIARETNVIRITNNRTKLHLLNIFIENISNRHGYQHALDNFAMCILTHAHEKSGHVQKGVGRGSQVSNAAHQKIHKDGIAREQHGPHL
jgi:hypothetical protein